MLLGNHEAIALMGLSFDYEGAVTVDQFLDFLPERYRAEKEAGIPAPGRAGRGHPSPLGKAGPN